MANLDRTSPDYLMISSPNTDVNRLQNETKLYIFIDSNTPITKRVPVPAGQLTLGQFKDFISLHGDHYKFFFQSHDAEFGTVKEELVDDDAILPLDDGRVVAWILTNDQAQSNALFEPVVENYSSNRLEELYKLESKKSLVSGSSPRNQEHFFRNNSQPSSPVYNYGSSFRFPNGKRATPPSSPTCVHVCLHLNGAQPLGLGHAYPGDDCPIDGILVDHVQKNSIADRDGNIRSGDRIVEVNGVDLRYMKIGEAVQVFRRIVERGGDINLVIQRPQDCKRASNLPPVKTPNILPRVPPRLPARGVPAMIDRELRQSTMPKAKSGFDPATELPEPVIEPDQLHNINQTQLNGPQRIINFHRNDNQNDNQRASQSLPRSLTPRSWFTTGNLDDMNPSSNLAIYQMDSRSDYETTAPSSLRSNLYQVPLHCGKDTIQTIYMALKADSTNLDVRDREWLKVIVKNAFLGSDLIKWLSRNVYGFCNRSEVKRYANQMLALGLIRSPISKATFSEKCFYTLT